MKSPLNRLNHQLNQKGSSHLIFLLALAVIVAVGIVSFRVMKSAEIDSENVATVSEVPAKTSAPKEIKSTSDLRQADEFLDDTAIDGSVDPNSLDSEISALR